MYAWSSSLFSYLSLEIQARALVFPLPAVNKKLSIFIDFLTTHVFPVYFQASFQKFFWIAYKGFIEVPWDFDNNTSPQLWLHEYLISQILNLKINVGKLESF